MTRRAFSILTISSLLLSLTGCGVSSAVPEPLKGQPPTALEIPRSTASEVPVGYAVAATQGSVFETTIAISPANPQIAVAAGMRFKINARERTKFVQTFWSDDGGLTWDYSDRMSLTTSKATYEFQGDPVVAFDSAGVAYAVTLVSAGPMGNSTRSGICVWRSTDGGRTWSEPMPIVERQGEKFDDKEWIGIDTTGGPRDGTMYVAWLRADSTRGGNIEFIFVRSTDGGRSWSDERVIGHGGGPQFAIGPDGEVHITYAEGLTMLSRTSWDGGETFTEPVTIERLAGPPGNLPGTEFMLYPFASSAADRSTGPGRGNVYTVWAASANAYPGYGNQLPGTIWFSRSIDAGRSWSAPVRLSDPSTGNDAMFPSLASDPATGDLVVAWLDRSHDPQNRLARVHATRSTDGGATFSTPIAFTSALDLSGNTFVGHYNGTAAEQGVVLTAFSDAAGRMGVARLSWKDEPDGPRRRAVRRP